MHDGSKLYLKKVAEDYDPTDKLAALRLLHETARARRVRDRRPLHRARQGRLLTLLNLVDEPLATCRSSACGRAGTCSTRSWKSSGMALSSRDGDSIRMSGSERASHATRDPAWLVRHWRVWRGHVARSAQAQKRPLNVDDIYNLKRRPRSAASPDGKWVAYTVARAIKDTDKNDTDVWMASWDGTQQIQLTSSPDERVPAALEPRRQVPRVRLVAAGREGRRRSGC